MKHLVSIAVATAMLWAWSGFSAWAAEEAEDHVIAGDPIDLEFYDRDFRSQVGMGARRSGPAARYRSADGASSYNCNNTVAGGDRAVRYPFTVPDSRFLEFVRVWGVKGVDTADLSLRVHRSCMTQSEVIPTTSVLVETTLTSTSDQFSTTLNTVSDQPDNRDCKYWLEVEFGSNATACATAHTNLRIYKMRIQSRMSDRIFRHGFRVHVPG